MNEDFEKEGRFEADHGGERFSASEGAGGMGRTPRPRIGSRQRIGNYEGHKSHYSQDRGGNSSYGYRPNYNHSDEGGYQPRPRFNRPQGEGGYQSRSYDCGQNFDRQGGYRQQRPYGQNRGYGAQGEGGDYRQGGYRKQGGGGYRQGSFRQNREFGDGQGSYRQNQGGFRQGNFRPGQGGGFNRGGQKRRPGYDPHAKYSQKKRLEYKEENFDPNAPIRLNKYLANAGMCSRRDADKYIEAGVITVNGQVVTELGTKVLRSDEVRFHESPVKIEKKVYVLLNKPKGYVTTSDDPQNRKTVMDLVKGACPERIYPVGRLDRNTTGVLLLTNDGEMASKLTHPQFLKKKIYHVHLDHNLTAADMRRIAEGIELEDGAIKADDIQYASETDKKQVGIEIHSGRNRIVRRIFESLGYHVTKLDRVFFAGLTKKKLPRGDWRFLTQEEVNFLRMGSFE